MTIQGKRTCPVCGTLFPDSSESCPVCALQGALKPESGASSIEDGTSELRFEHYRVLQNEDGTPIELGHGAMGMTYKAVDVSLRRAVALKVIDARFVGDQPARQRFLREARAAASLPATRAQWQLALTLAISSVPVSVSGQLELKHQCLGNGFLVFPANG